MKRIVLSLAALALLLPASAVAQQEETYDYWRFQRDMVRYGQQAILMCNGLFTGERTLEQVFGQELAFLPEPVGTPASGDYEVDWEREAVSIGASHGTPIMRAAYRKGIGCVILPPDQTYEDIADLPELDLPYPPGDPAMIRSYEAVVIGGGLNGLVAAATLAKSGVRVLLLEARSEVGVLLTCCPSTKTFMLSMTGAAHGSIFSPRSPGRNPMLSSQASRTGLMMTICSKPFWAARRYCRAIPTAMAVFPVPAGPVQKIMSLSLISCM